MTRLFFALLTLFFSGPAMGENSDFRRCLLAATTVGVETKAIAPYFPSNNGFIGATERRFLMPGQQIDRYGGSGFSRFFSPAGTPEAA